MVPARSNRSTKHFAKDFSDGFDGTISRALAEDSRLVGPRRIEGRAIKQLPRFQVETGPKGRGHAGVAVLAILAAEVFAPGKMQGGRAVPDRDRLPFERTPLARV